MTDNSRTYTSVIDTRVHDNGMDYLDINIYVTCPDGSEWRRTVSMNKNRQDGRQPREQASEWSIVDCYAESEYALFDEAAKVPPDGVRMMFGERWEEAIALLKTEYARQTNVKDHAEEMLKTLKGVHEFLNRWGGSPHIVATLKHTIDKVEGRE
jgi:hypothetical protein